MGQLTYDILFIGSGVFLTLGLLFGGLILGTILGVTISILRYNNICSFIISRWISLFRGTPLILQLSLIYFTAPSIIGIKLSVIQAGIIAFGFNSSAYIAEILRSGIESIAKGQFEAAKTLKISKYYTWRDIILPQVIRNTFPSFVNEIISLLKETALIGTISGMDIMRMAQTLGAQQFTYFMPLCIAAVYYYILVISIEFIGKIIEKRGWYAQN